MTRLAGGRCPPKRFTVIARGKRAFRLGIPMAEHNEVAYTTADGNDYVAHEQTYEGFIMLVKYGTIGVVIIVALMGYFLT